MAFTGVRLSWVAFRLGAMINYEFSNLLHNEVTPSNPIKKNFTRICGLVFFFFFVNIYFPGISSFFFHLQTGLINIYIYLFFLEKRK